jgi:hypothetical protein
MTANERQELRRNLSRAGCLIGGPQAKPETEPEYVEDAHDPNELLRCEICGIDFEGNDCEPIEMAGGKILMACHECVLKAEHAKLDAAVDEHAQWVDDQMTEEQRLGKGGY